MSIHRIIQIMPADGWLYEDREGGPKRGAEVGGYWYSHERLVALALCELTDVIAHDEETWRVVHGLTRWESGEESDHVQPESMRHAKETDCEGHWDEVAGECRHWQAMPKEATDAKGH